MTMSPSPERTELARSSTEIATIIFPQFSGCEYIGTKGLERQTGVAIDFEDNVTLMPMTICGTTKKSVCAMQIPIESLSEFIEQLKGILEKHEAIT